MRVLLPSGVVAMFKPLIDSCPSVIPVDYDEGSGAYQTLVAVAECDVTQRIVYVVCQLAYTTNYQPIPASLWFHEFSFYIYVNSIDGADLSVLTQNRNIARNYIPAISIPLIMDIVVRSCEALIRMVKPDVVYRVTKVLFPIQKALVKHDLITNSMYQLGYGLLETGTDRFGRSYWVMTRQKN
jgi:hypothetical protein